MNVFVLCTGRCASQTFARAAQHITNFSAGHETRVQRLGAERVAYPERHIEVDCRLAWFLGRLDSAYGRDAFYVHLIRDPEATAQSFAKRFHWQGSIPIAYRDGILMLTDEPRLDCCRDYVTTATENISHFLRDKPSMEFHVETAAEHWPVFWSRIGAEGDYAASLAEWGAAYDQKPPLPTLSFRGEVRRRMSLAARIILGMDGARP